MFNPGSVLGSTFYASREPVRNPLSLKLVHTARTIGSEEPALIGSIGHRIIRGFLLTTDATLCKVVESDIVEVADYDPVRKTSMVIGMKEPSRYVPLHWLGLQTHPDKLVTMFLFLDGPPPGVNVFSSKLLQGSFEQAMEIAKALKASKKDMIFIDGGGLFMVTKDLNTLQKDFSVLLDKARSETKKKKKATPGKRPKKKN